MAEGFTYKAFTVNNETFEVGVNGVVSVAVGPASLPGFFMLEAKQEDDSKTRRFFAPAHLILLELGDPTVVPDQQIAVAKAPLVIPSHRRQQEPD